jgi:DNA-binding XRE family transcriptional regulator
MTLTPVQLKAARGKLEWSKGNIAGVARVGRLTFVNFENGKTTPAFPVLSDIRIALEAAGADLNKMSAQAASTQQGRQPLSDESRQQRSRE